MMKKPYVNLVGVATLMVALCGAADLRAGCIPGGTAPNDECSTAVQVDVAAECSGSIAVYDALDATTSQPAAACSGMTSADARDLWFNFVAIGSITRVLVEGTLTYDPVVEAFSGSCGALMSIGCVDATFPPAVPANTIETLTLSTTIGDTYYVRVYDYTLPQPADHTFGLCIFELALPSNDECFAVAPIVLIPDEPREFTGDNTDCTDTEGLGLPQVWHAFSVTECMDVTIDLCGTSPAFLNWSRRLYTSCSLVGGGILESSSELTSCADGNITLLFNDVRPGTYYFPVVRDDAPETLAVGPYALRISGALATAYCAAALLECDETIGRVTIGSIDNASGCGAGAVVDYTAQSTDIEHDGSLSVVVVNGGSAYMDDSVAVFVDWNHDHSFCEGNEVHVLSSNDDGATFTGTVVCPTDAAVGPTRMRVRMAYGSKVRPCGTDEFGEIEDYTVNVLLSSSIAENSPLDWALFPNPNTGDMTVRFGGRDANVMIELFDLAGRVAHQEQRQLFNGQQVSLGLAGSVANGAYTLRLTSPQGRSEQRVVVQ